MTFVSSRHKDRVHSVTSWLDVKVLNGIILPLFVILLNSEGSGIIAQTVRMAIFAPRACAGEPHLYADTAERAIIHSSIQGGNQALSVQHDIYDSCSQSYAITKIAGVFRDRSHDVVIGPGNIALCEIAASLAADANLPLVSWNCLSNKLSNRRVFHTTARTVPSSRVIADAMATVLRHFQWKHIAIVTSLNGPYLEMAGEMHYVLSHGNFSVGQFIEIDDQTTQEDMERSLLGIHANIKGTSALKYCATG